jgi:hypothetical protein
MSRARAGQQTSGVVPCPALIVLRPPRRHVRVGGRGRGIARVNFLRSCDLTVFPVINFPLCLTGECDQHHSHRDRIHLAIWGTPTGRNLKVSFFLRLYCQEWPYGPAPSLFRMLPVCPIRWRSLLHRSMKPAVLAIKEFRSCSFTEVSACFLQHHLATCREGDKAACGCPPTGGVARDNRRPG